jgi:arabinose-5-phosphate isomerase
LKRRGTRLIAMTGNARSTLAQAADVTLDCRVSEEACPMNLVPTASTTAMLALGDALAMTVLVERGFQPEDFANLHPGGKLGKRLKRVEQLMHQGEQVPLVTPATAMLDVIYEMSRKGLGMTCVVDDDRTLRGIITDGDLRRKVASFDNVLERTAADIMTPNPIAIGRRTLAAQALNMLEQRKITSLIVVDDARKVEGVIHLHHLWRTDLV